MRAQSPDAVRQIISTNELRMFTRYQEHLTKSLGRQMPCLGDDFIDPKSDAQNRIVAREATVTAVVDAFVAQIKRGKHPHRASEILPGQLARFLRYLLETRVVQRCKERGKTSH